MGSRQHPGNVMRSFKGDVTSTTSPPTMTSFSSRKAPNIEPLATPSADQFIQQRDGSLASSPYANRSLQRTGAPHSYDDDVIELPPEMHPMANNYQQSRKSTVIRIDARNIPDGGGGGSLKRRAPSSRGPISPQPPVNDNLGVNYPKTDNRRIVKTSSASSMSRGHKPQTATPPPSQFNFNHSQAISPTPPPAYAGSQSQFSEFNSLPEDATLPYQHPRPVPTRAHGTALDRSEEQGGWNGKSNGKPRVTFASGEVKKKTDSRKDERREIENQPSKGMRMQNRDDSKTKGGQVSEEPGKELSPLHRPKVLCVVICFLGVLLIITIVLLAHFATRDKMTEIGSDRNKEWKKEMASQTPPPQTIHIPKITKVTNMPVFKEPRKKLCLRKDCIRTAGAILSKINRRKDPCEDFYSYSCGGWLKNNYIRLNSDQNGISSEIAERNDRLIYELLLRPPVNRTVMMERNITVAEEKAKRFYKSCIDEISIENLESRPLMDKIADMGGWDAFGTWDESTWDLDEQLYQNQGVLSTSVLFGIDVEIDPTNTSKYILLVGQNGVLTLPDRSLYLSREQNPEQLESLFKKVARKLLEQLKVVDIDSIDSVVNDIYSFEQKLAEIQIPFDQISVQNFETISISELAGLCPKIQWFRLFRRIVSMIPLQQSTRILIHGTREYFRNLSGLLMKTPPRVIHNYMMWRFVFSWSSRLSIPFRNIVADFTYALTGEKVTVPRKEECLRYVKQQFPDALGLMYVREAFTPSDKEQVTGITNYVKRAFIQNLKSLPWTDVTTRNEMIAKLTTIDVKIGYDERMLLDTSIVDRKYQVSEDAFDVYENTYFNNYIDSVKSKIRQAANKLIGSVDQMEWNLPFYSTGAFYVRSTNQMILPAGLLQPPMFDRQAPEEVNFGSIGSTIAHELLHGFEDWLARDQNIYSCVRRTYSNYEVKELKMNVNGYHTEAENVADMGGLRIAFKAYKLRIAEDNRTRRALPGMELSSDKLFFVSFAQSWCMKRTLKSQQIQLIEGIHAPERYRVIGSVSNFNEFANAFRCEEGSAMKPRDQCVVW